MPRRSQRRLGRSRRRGSLRGVLPRCSRPRRIPRAAPRREMAHLRRRSRPARSTRRWRRSRPTTSPLARGVARAVARRAVEHDDARRRRVDGPSGRCLRRAQPARPDALARRRAAVHRQLQGHATHGGRPALPEHADLGRRGLRCRHRAPALGLQPQELRSRHHDDEPAMESARRGLLERRRRRPRVLGHRRWLPGGGGCHDRPSRRRASA